MAKDGDIIDVMFGWIISLFGWILGGIVKLIMAIIGSLFKGIVGYSRRAKLRFRIKLHQGVCKKASIEYAWSNRPSNNRVGVTSLFNVYNYGIKFQRS